MIGQTLRVNLLIQAGTFATSVLVARLLGPDGRGQLASAMLYPNLMAWIGMLGVDRVLAVLGGSGEIRAPFRAMFTITGLLAAVVTPLAGLLVHLQVSDAAVAQAAYMYLAVIPALQLYNFACYYLNGVGDFPRFNSARLVFYGVYLFLIIGLVIAQPTDALSLVLMANITGFAVGALVAATLVRRHSWSGLAVGPVSHNDLRQIARLAVPFALPAMLAHFNASTYLVVLQQRADAAAIGLFVVMYAFSRLLAPAGSAVASHVFRAGIEGECTMLPVAYRRTLLCLSIFALPLWAMSFVLVPLLFGRSFVVDEAAMAALCMACVLALSTDLLAEFLKGQRRVRDDSIAMAVNVAAAMGIGWWAVPTQSLVGMAIGLVAGELLRLATLRRAVARLVTLPVGTVWSPGFDDLRALIAIALAAAGPRAR